MSSKDGIVLAGWLGCQPRHLRRHIALYESFGYEVVSFIASPAMVVQKTFSTSWNHPSEQPQNKKIQTLETMDDLALHAMDELRSRKIQRIVFHAFSNSGCFLWESFQRLLDDKTTNPTNIEVNGLVFDSCPAWFGGDEFVLGRALALCSPQEKQELTKRNVADRGKMVKQQWQLRNNQFFQFLIRDSRDIPQLYLYSASDKLADHQMIDRLIDHRTKQQRHMLLKKKWDTSRHCSHILDHPAEYASAVSALVLHSFTFAKI